ncbi:MAG: type II toxin-antitoxin system HicA family toxin [Dyadobacter sp.]|nr:type II toxin-antitoxin system HicA family toxin [Dyadobacter sp.]
MRHPIKEEQLVVPYHGSKEVKKGLLAALLKKADVKTNKR